MKKRIATSFLALLMLMTLAFGACAGGGSSKDTLNLYLNTALGSLDPANTTAITDKHVIRQVYDTLVFVNDDHTLEYRLAESYTVSDDSLTYTFKLRKGVKFHNGEELKADDVVFTLDRYISSPYKATYVNQIASCTAADDYTVSITLKSAYAPFIEVVGQQFPICNRKAIEDAAANGVNYDLNPIGTGAYKLVKYDAGNMAHLTRFDDYFRGKAPIKDVYMSVITDPNTYTMGIQTGDIDYGGVSPTAVASIKSDESLKYHQGITGHVYYVIMNHEVAPFDNKLVRQAINYAIDRKFIVDVAAGGNAVGTSIMVSPVVFGYSDDLDQNYLERDVEKAKALLQQAGITTPIDIGPISTLDGIFKTIAEIVAENLKEIGLNCTVEISEANKYIEDAVTGNYGIGMMGIDMGYDGDGFFNIYSEENINGNNLARYINTSVEEKFLEARGTLDATKRAGMYADIFNIVNEDAVYGALFHMETMYAYNKDLKFSRMNQGQYECFDFSWS